MFGWARKQKLSQRNSVSKSNKSCAETDLQSYPSSPAHSTFSVQSPGKRSGTKQKLKIILTHNKSNTRNVNKPLATNIQGSLSKLELLRFIDCKKTKNNMELNKVEKSNEIIGEIPSRKQIKIKIQVNKLLDQYCRAAKQFLEYKIWGIFALAMILFKLGFTQDLVNDRNIAKQLWQNLKEPDQLGLYVFLEQVQNQKVQIQMATTKLCSELNIKAEQLNKTKALDIIRERKCQNMYQNLKLNRLRRQKRVQNVRTQVI